MTEQRYSANDRRKKFIINHNESDLHRPGIEPGIATQLNELQLNTSRDFDAEASSRRIEK
jgi:hypothetical protein